MIARISILNTASILFIIGSLTYLVFNWNILSLNKDFDLIILYGFILLGISGIIIDEILKVIIPNRLKVNLIELFITGFSAFFLLSLNNLI